MAETITDPWHAHSNVEDEYAKELLKHLEQRLALEARLEKIAKIERAWNPRRRAHAYIIFTLGCAFFMYQAVWVLANSSAESKLLLEGLACLLLAIGFYTVLMTGYLDLRAARREKPLIEATLELESLTKQAR